MFMEFFMVLSEKTVYLAVFNDESPSESAFLCRNYSNFIHKIANWNLSQVNKY